MQINIQKLNRNRLHACMYALGPSRTGDLQVKKRPEAELQRSTPIRDTNSYQRPLVSTTLI